MIVIYQLYLILLSIKYEVESLQPHQILADH